MKQRSAQGSRSQGSTVDESEVAKFTALAEEWWDPNGKFRPLHRLNPTRLTFIRDRIAGHSRRDVTGARPLAGLKILDIGCGGGLLSEPLARLGGAVTGIDAAARNIEIARHHASQSGLDIDYRAVAAEDLATRNARFDVVLTMEVVEHVADLEAFLAACAGLLAPGGLLVAATLNRTPKSFLLAIVGAEYLLRWLPRGTHDWRRFVKPSELAAGLRSNGLTVRELTGVVYNPLSDSWRLAPRDLEVNYMAVATKT